MLRIKSAQIPQFTNVDVRRIFGYATDILQTPEDDVASPNPELSRDAEIIHRLRRVRVQKLMEAEQNLIRTNPHISLQELTATPLGKYLQEVLGTDNWVLDPNRGIGQ